jgi:hypothetical protein
MGGETRQDGLVIAGRELVFLCSNDSIVVMRLHEKKQNKTILGDTYEHSL